MAGLYRLFGSEMSPYSVKVRAYLRYKAIPHAWIARRAENDTEYRRFSRLPIVPTLVTPDDEGLQDSTPIIERLEAAFPTPSIHPDSRELAFLSALVEEFGDEWGNKLMFHHRWYDALDQQSAALCLARLSLPHGGEEEVRARAGMIRDRMTTRGAFVGSSDETAPLITDYLFQLLDILEAHLSGRRCLFGARPAFGDFGLSAQLYEASVDPTCGAIIRARGPAVLAWCQRMLDPREEGPFETWEALEPSLAPLIRYIGRFFLPWSEANAAALREGQEVFRVPLPGGDYVQPPQKYHARSLSALRDKYAEVAADAKLRGILRDAGCLAHLA